mgnify:CR=1 FL=1
MSTLKVNTIRHTGASSDAVTLASDGTCTVKATNKSNRNLVINGAMLVNQRATQATSTGYNSIDRFAFYHLNVDEAPTYAQSDVASGTTPYELGFRKCLRVMNGNQTSGAGAADNITVDYRFEAQDIANSGWNYTSASSYITLSFWIKSSVAQDFKLQLKSEDGTEKAYPMSTGALSANTWTKITKTIPGHADLQFDNNNAKGFNIHWFAFLGTDLTASVTDNAWINYSGSSKVNDCTSTWYTTNDATLDITGVQLEVGDTATDFEHRSYGDELARCQRYYYKNVSSANYTTFSIVAAYSTSNGYGMVNFPVPLRDDGDGISFGYSALGDFRVLINGTSTTPTEMNLDDRGSVYGGQLFVKSASGYTAGQAGWLRSHSTSAYLTWDAEV